MRAGVLSADKAINPQWADANHVNIVYCSSDLWTGSFVSVMGLFEVDEPGVIRI
jgi:hypothetical protein